MTTTSTPTVVANTMSLGKVAVADGIVYLLTDCCGASATGTEQGTACRACYRPVPEWKGWAALADNATLAHEFARLLVLATPAYAASPTILADMAGSLAGAVRAA
jgi:hypothetical protein